MQSGRACCSLIAPRLPERNHIGGPIYSAKMAQFFAAAVIASRKQKT